ncbi:hypothetical protein CROQUDRAFT_48855 [Cronartium quercuum f. sp. fusiforme G11]|uniref:Uncharacterized protein n=1 Tax=Cronartium quercuum f. sp. fusiforme G11 TaxID=708437 RepID=A0A9P6NCH1_9BASI|nr:hypothetical protein CROQUDRAFT_48855 [Cronartium quercuum f. sp. fusiforme G11]
MLKSMKCVESLLGALSQLNEVQQTLNKCQKKIMKGCKDLANILTDDTMSKENINENVLVNTLMCASCFFGSLHEVTTKTAKTTEKEYNNLEDAVLKAFNRIVKEERAHDERLDALEGKIQKANYTFDKHRKPAKRGMSHTDSQEGTVAADRYHASVASLGLDVTKSKLAHSSKMYSRRDSLCRILCRSVFQIAENEWRRSCEEVRRAGLVVGRMTMWANFCTHDGMPKKMPESILNEESAFGLRTQISRQNTPGLATTTFIPNQAEKLDDGQEKLYTTSGLGLVRSTSMTLGPRQNLDSMSPFIPSPALEGSFVSTGQQAVSSTQYLPEALDGALGRSPRLPVCDDAGSGLTFTVATAPLALRKTSHQSHQGASPKPEESKTTSALEGLSAYQDRFPSQLLRSLSAQDAPKFDFVNPMSADELATIKAHHRVVESHNATVELTRLLEHKIKSSSQSQKSSDQTQSLSTASTLAESSYVHQIPGNQNQAAETISNSQSSPVRSNLRINDPKEHSARQSVSGTSPYTKEPCRSRKDEESPSPLERQISIASLGSTSRNVANVKKVFLAQSKKNFEDTTSPSLSPSYATSSSAEQFPVHANSVAALASHFSALTDPYLRQFEPRPFTEVASIPRRVPSPIPIQRPRLYNHRSNTDVENPVMTPTYQVSSGFPSLIPNRSLTQPSPQHIKLYAQQTKVRENSQKS